MIQIKSFVFNPFQENTYVLFDETKEAIVIDPGCFDAAEKKQLDNFIAANSLKVVLLLNTHCHIDHVLGNYHVKEKYKVPLKLHRLDEPQLRAIKSYATNYGIDNFEETTPDGYLDESDKIKWGESQLDILFLPGHAPGHLAFYSEKQKFIVAGDVLFQGSIGRTDLPGGDMDTLIDSIQQKLFVLPDNTTVHSGHGSATTIGKEKVSNPFVGIHAQ